METLTPIWKSKNGEIEINKMSDDHLQKAYKSAEYSFMKYENLAIEVADKAHLFNTKLKELEREAKDRNLNLESLTQRDENKFGILRQRRRTVAME